MVKKGDTLIEVTIAVGIFSMVAIAMVAVMSNGVANAQTALETTLTRQEIDTQAEALRFIHSAYISNAKRSGEDGEENKYTALWREITKNAILLEGENDYQVMEFAPNSCESLYNASELDSIYNQNAFVINPRMLGSFEKETLDEVFVKADNENNKFVEASIYPRIMYGANESELDDTVLTNQYDTFYRAEGIYVVPVRDSGTTTVVGGGDGWQKTSAFYDFYIRTCWYGSGSNDASSISTVIRLYDPDIKVSPEG